MHSTSEPLGHALSGAKQHSCHSGGELPSKPEAAHWYFLMDLTGREVPILREGSQMEHATRKPQLMSPHRFNERKPDATAHAPSRQPSAFLQGERLYH